MRVEVEDITQVGFTTRWTMEKERHLTISDGLLGWVIIDDKSCKYSQSTVPSEKKKNWPCQPLSQNHSPMAQPEKGARYWRGVVKAVAATMMVYFIRWVQRLTVVRDVKTNRCSYGQGMSERWVYDSNSVHHDRLGEVVKTLGWRSRERSCIAALLVLGRIRRPAAPSEETYLVQESENKLYKDML